MLSVLPIPGGPFFRSSSRIFSCQRVGSDDAEGVGAGSVLLKPAAASREISLIRDPFLYLLPLIDDFPCDLSGATGRLQSHSLEECLRTRSIEDILEFNLVYQYVRIVAAKARGPRIDVVKIRYATVVLIKCVVIIDRPGRSRNCVGARHPVAPH